MAGPTTEKPEVNQTEHIELDGDANVKIDGYDSYGLVKSRFDELSIPRTLWVFRRVVLVTLAVYTGYVCEGFEVSLLFPFATSSTDLQDLAWCGWKCHCQPWLHKTVWFRGW